MRGEPRDAGNGSGTPTGELSLSEKFVAWKLMMNSASAAAGMSLTVQRSGTVDSPSRHAILWLVGQDGVALLTCTGHRHHMPLPFVPDSEAWRCVRTQEVVELEIYIISFQQELVC